MPGIGQRGTWLIAGLLVAAIPSLWMWGFTVDDALISVRYARHLVAGLGWRFDGAGPPTDGVTPLPWPLLLAPLAHADALTVLARSKVLGLLAWCVAGAALGRAVGAQERAPVWTRAGALVALALSVPVAAYAVSGMETSVATALATFAALQVERPRVAAALAGLAAALRPELAPWACVLAVGLALASRRGVADAVTAGGIALGPFAACALVRVVVWDRPAPLALLAKPSDLAHGLPYAGAACVVAVVPLLVLAPFALRRSPAGLALALAGVTHVAAMAVAGGDWMPYARLIVPVVPSLAWAAVLAAPHAHPMATAGRSVGAIAWGLLQIARGGTDGRHAGADRVALIEATRPALVGCKMVAAEDIGWVSAATEADILDLGGVTDPAIAALPGGHTSKRVDGILLLDRGADALLLYAPSGLPPDGLQAWTDATYGYVVLARLAVDPTVVHHFTPTTWLPLGTKGAGYVLLRAQEAK
jgi:hypothetical protein